MCFKHLPDEVNTTGFFFIRKSDDAVPIPLSGADANATLSTCFETGTVTPKSLGDLERLLSHVYIPMLAISGQRGVGQLNDQLSLTPSESRMKALMRDELLINVQKFASQIQHAIQHVEGEVKLEIPEMTIAEDPSVVIKNPAIVRDLEKAMEGWAHSISVTIDELLRKQPQGSGPLAEIDIWKERYSVLNAMYEQLKSPSVQSMLAVMKLAGIPSFSNFEYHRGELNKYYLEARDNVKFLGTLERHFKNIAHGANFTIVLETIPAMMNSLRMVWVISRHYNTDERMVPLMERISWELCERASRVINLRSIFK